MTFGGGGGGSSSIATASDVAYTHSPPNAGDFLYNTGTKWVDQPLVGTVAMATGGGQETVKTISAASGAKTLDLSTGNVFDVTLTGNVTLTFASAISGQACSFSLYLHQGSGAYTVTWPSGTKWAGGVAPTLSTGNGAVDVLVFETLNGGTTWYGSLVGANFS